MLLLTAAKSDQCHQCLDLSLKLLQYPGNCVNIELDLEVKLGNGDGSLLISAIQVECVRLYCIVSHSMRGYVRFEVECDL